MNKTIYVREATLARIALLSALLKTSPNTLIERAVAELESHTRPSPEPNPLTVPASSWTTGL